MQDLLGYCGYKCDICPVYEKNQNPGLDKQYISDKWFQYFDFRVPPEGIFCAGCRNEGRHPDSECPVRPCAIEKGIDNCAHCDSFGCEDLKSRMEFAENKLRDIESMPQEDYKLFIEPYLGKMRLAAIRSKK